jgi:hypothetical protein
MRMVAIMALRAGFEVGFPLYAMSWERGIKISITRRDRWSREKRAYDSSSSWQRDVEDSGWLSEWRPGPSWTTRSRPRPIDIVWEEEE